MDYPQNGCMVRIIGLGEYAVSSCGEDSIKTFALGTCIGLVLYNIKEKKLGMVHIVLPVRLDNRGEIVRKKEGYFADVGVPLLFEKVFNGFPVLRKDYFVSVYGGAVSKSGDDCFCVGLRNLGKVEDILNKHKIHYNKQYTGGQNSRTIEAFVSDGRVIVKEQKMSFLDK